MKIIFVKIVENWLRIYMKMSENVHFKFIPHWILNFDNLLIKTLENITSSELSRQKIPLKIFQSMGHI